jgi:hypothetical protein
MRSFESFRKEAKRWLADLRAGEPAAIARYRAVFNEPAGTPTLRDVQLALARENGFAGWTALKDAVERAAASRRSAGAALLALYEEAALALLDAYELGTPAAMEAHYRFTWHRRSWSAMRTYVELDLGKRAEITLDDARHLVALEYGFTGWPALISFAATPPRTNRLSAKPVGVSPSSDNDVDDALFFGRDWNEALVMLRAHPDACLRANGQATDDILADVAGIAGARAIDLNGSQAVTDDGILRLRSLTQLEYLDLSGTAVTDRGLAVITQMPALRTLIVRGTRLTDVGLQAFARCPMLERVELQWTATGDGAIRALMGHERLLYFATGNAVTDAGLPLLHEIPAFRSWRDGEKEMALTSYRAGPNQLSLRGTFTDRGLRALRGLDGLFALNLDASELGITAAAMDPLADLAHLEWLAVDAKDDWMPFIAMMPHLRFLGAQDTSAGDDGFAALAASPSIEFIWGRRCHNLGTRGFAALARMPRLRGLSVSCKNVADEGVAVLPSFPALRELMPMDVPDAGYRHIGRCENLESLILMYCRDTTDAATERITGLPKLTSYFNSYTAITDRTPRLLATMPLLERVTFDGCHGLTDDGVAALDALPRLREVRVSGSRVTPQVAARFREGVRVRASA